jgi:Spy/CpxP family protein refolding chaperone
VKKLITMICAFLIFCTSAQTQTSSDEAVQNYNDAVKIYSDAVQQLQRANLRSQKRQIIQKSVSMTSEQSQKFWPIYDKYEAELMKVNDERLALIADYANQKDGISSEKAAQLINSVMQIQAGRHELKRNYVKDIGTVLTAKQALRLLLLENQIDLGIEAQIAAQIPL